MLSLFNSVLNWIFRIGIIKFVVFGALALLLEPLMALLMDLIDSAGISDVAAMLGALPNDIRFYLMLFRFDIGAPIIVAAALTRFFIRRLPVVG